MEREAALIVLRAIAKNPTLKNSLFLKGAYATEAYTQKSRSTKDIDFTVVRHLYPTNHIGTDNLKQLFTRTLQNHLEAADEDWSLHVISARKSADHPRGWDGFEVKITLAFRGRTRYTVKLDISPEEPPISTVEIDCMTGTVVESPNRATVTLLSYSADEIIAEKLRAFLQRLPPYRNKVNSGKRPPRVRDIWDIFTMVDVLGESLNLREIAEIFKRKCKSKHVDCKTPADFCPEPNSLEIFRQDYENDPELIQVPFETAWKAMMGLVEEIEKQFGLPGEYPL